MDRARIRVFIQKRPLSTYVLLTYVFSWIFLIPSFYLLRQSGLNTDAWTGSVSPLAFIGIIGVFGPSLAALVLTGLSSGKKGVVLLLKKLIHWRVWYGWYGVALLAPLVIAYGAVLVATLFGFPLGQAHYSTLILGIVSGIAFAIPFGPLPEELGWRGYALPMLLKRYGPWGGSLILGIVWTLWHIPALSVPGIAIPSVFDVTVGTFVLYFLELTGITLIMTALYYKTRGSVLIAILVHAAFNASSGTVFALFPDIEAVIAHREIIYLLTVVLLLGVGIVMTARMKPSRRVSLQA